MNVRTFWIIGIIVFLGITYYLVSPLWRVKVADEISPLATVQALPLAQLPAASSAPLAFSQPHLLAEGDFVPKEHDVKGKALLIEDNGTKILRFENFETINGPDLNIYLASDFSNKDIVDLGNIKATKGNVNYEIPAGVDTTKYNKVLVWCVQFHALFSAAELIPL